MDLVFFSFFHSNNKINSVLTHNNKAGKLIKYKQIKANLQFEIKGICADNTYFLE